MNQNKRCYTYEGPVLCFDQIVCPHWSGQTYAVSEGKAKANLAYQFKRQTNRTPDCRITLPGKMDCN